MNGGIKLKTQVKKKIFKIKSYFENYSSRKKLINKDFTIISDNCWGGQVYQDLGIEYNTPFIGLFIVSPDYIRLVKNLEHYLSQPLTFINSSKYRDNVQYPIGLLDDVEIHFMHYKNEKEAIEKWNRRLNRMNWDNLFFKVNDRDYCTDRLLKEFDELSYSRKIIFTAQKNGDLKNSIWFKEHSNEDYVAPELRTYKKYFDVVNWLNQGGHSFNSSKIENY